MSQFDFLRAEWLAVHESAAKAAGLVYADPRTSCFYARRTLELAVAWMFKHDAGLQLPYQENISALLHEPSFKKTVGEAVFNKAKVIVRLGNQAVHSHRPIQQYDALTAVKELFHVCYWLAHTYARGAKPSPCLTFNPDALPKTTPLPQQTVDQLQQLETKLRESNENLKELLTKNAELDADLQRTRAEIAAARQAAAATPDAHDYSEAETRDYFIDLLLKEAGWPLDQERDREYKVAGMPNNEGVGYVDYVLWGEDGLPLGLVEAKRTRREARVGQQQAKLYADCLEQEFKRRPVIFYSNGYEHWLWDDTNHPPRPVQGFYKRDELELLIQRRDSRKSLVAAEVNKEIVERYYQWRAIRRVAESFEQDHERKALLVMATGAGKTRTVIALCDLLMRCNWAKRVLFLADRVALVNQAIKAFKVHLPDSSPVNLVTERETTGRVMASTYPTMMGLINDTRDGPRRFGVGHFDLVVIDEAHRSVFQKYRAIFEYFDSYLVGLTATPKEEVEKNTYDLFDLDNGVPTDAYTLDEAVHDKFLVPPRSVSVPLRFQRQGINYNDLSEEEKEQWDEIEWDEDGTPPPNRVEAEAVNKWLFNIDTVDKVLAHLMERGQKVAGGDRLGKTIIFAKNQAHANFIQERFDINYPKLKGKFARVITFETEYAQSLIDDFSKKESDPHIAISVDMLDTGIDVPEVVNLVFFKLVRSKTKFWQMLGRGTRLCPDLFGPGEHKQFFYVFDYCQNLEFFSQNPPTTDGALNESLGTRLFKYRLELVAALEHRQGSGSVEAQAAERTVIRETLDLLRTTVAAMNVENFIVRAKRRLVEKYQQPEIWQTLSEEAHHELADEIANLPSELEPEAEEAKRFDLLLLRLQLAVLNAEPGFVRLRDQVREIAELLEEKAAIPMVREQLPLIQDLQTDAWWQDITAPMLENVRKKLRNLVQFIEKKQRKIVYTNFEDEMGTETSIQLPGFTAEDNFEKFRAKTQAFLLAHTDHIAIHKLRMNKPLTRSDLAELERMLAESGVAGREQIQRAAEESHGLGLFVRSLIGLDREAAKQAFAQFMQGKHLSANQIEFVNLIINHLTQHGVIDAGMLYESPFTDLATQGPEGLFTAEQLNEIISILEQINTSALAA
jgi:type I restriction enzyme, R subunit